MKLISWLPQVHLRLVQPEEIGSLDPTGLAFWNLNTPEEFQQAQGQLSNALSRLLVVVERYPELRASQNFLSLQAQLEGTENRISVERGNFNTAVQNYNIAVRSFPTNLIAGMLGFAPRPFFTAREGAEIVASPCENCRLQITELNEKHELGLRIVPVMELVAEALR